MSSSKARFFNPAVVGLIMLSFFLGTSEYTVIGILPEIADGFGISLTQAGSIVSLFAFAYGLGTPFLAAYVFMEFTKIEYWRIYICYRNRLADCTESFD